MGLLEIEDYRLADGMVRLSARLIEAVLFILRLLFTGSVSQRSIEFSSKLLESTKF